MKAHIKVPYFPLKCFNILAVKFDKFCFNARYIRREIVHTAGGGWLRTDWGGSLYHRAGDTGILDNTKIIQN